MSSPDSELGSRRRGLAYRSVDRAIESRRAAYEDEVKRLIDASFTLVRKTGSLEPKVGEIVAEAGLSNQAFYKHFRSKDELLLAVLDEGNHMLRDYLEHRMSKARTPVRRIRNWLSGMLEQALNDESASATRPFAMSRARLSELFPEEVRESESQISAMLRAAIQEAIDSGALPHADAERDATILYNLAMGWVERALVEAGGARRADADYLVAFAMHGLKRGVSD
jgi:AcrR family transcriptional regulator